MAVVNEKLEGRETAERPDWSASLPARRATAAPLTLTLRSSSNTTLHTLVDVVVGDVFLFSGQSNIDILKRLGAGYEAVQQPARALEAHQAILGLRPDDLAASNSAAWIMATSASAELRNPEGALAAAERNLARARTSPLHLETAAAARAAVGDFTGATAAADDAIALYVERGDQQARAQAEQRRARYAAGEALHLQ